MQQWQIITYTGIRYSIFFYFNLFKGTYRYFRRVKRVDQVWTEFAGSVKQAITDQAKIIDPAVPV